MTPKSDEQSLTAAERDPARELKRRTRRSFLTGIVAAAGGYGGWRWLTSRDESEGTPWPFRKLFHLNEAISRRLFNPARLAKEYLPSEADAEHRTNGDAGLLTPMDAASWRLRVEGLATGVASLTMEDILAFPKRTQTTELNCIEGWTNVTTWAGARFVDFLLRYPPKTASGQPADLHNRPEDLPRYVAMETPDGEYYVGLDLPSLIQPQALLCYEINGKSVLPEHGAPLRLVAPVKYGIKNIKRIGVIRYTNERPRDYWAERGYDWYAGL